MAHTSSSLGYLFIQYFLSVHSQNRHFARIREDSSSLLIFLHQAHQFSVDLCSYYFKLQTYIQANILSVIFCEIDISKRNRSRPKSAQLLKNMHKRNIDKLTYTKTSYIRGRTPVPKWKPIQCHQTTQSPTAILWIVIALRLC